MYSARYGFDSKPESWIFQVLLWILSADPLQFDTRVNYKAETSS